MTLLFTAVTTSASAKGCCFTTMKKSLKKGTELQQEGRNVLCKTLMSVQSVLYDLHFPSDTRPGLTRSLSDVILFFSKVCHLAANQHATSTENIALHSGLHVEKDFWSCISRMSQLNREAFQVT